MEGRTNANFRALREMVGHSLHSLADAAGVQDRTVKRWDRGDSYRPVPDDVWELLEGQSEMQRRVVDAAVSHVTSARERGDLDEAVITYWASEEDYAEAHAGEARDSSAWLRSNANARLVGHELDRLGVPYRFEYDPGVRETRKYAPHDFGDE